MCIRDRCFVAFREVLVLSLCKSAKYCQHIFFRGGVLLQVFNQAGESITLCRLKILYAPKQYLYQLLADYLFSGLVRANTLVQIAKLWVEDCAMPQLVQEGKGANAVFEPRNEVLVAYEGIVHIFLTSDMH